MSIFAALFLVAVAASPAPGADDTASGIAIERPWARATAGTSRPGAAFLTVKNHGDSDDKLVGAASPVAGRVEIHQTIMENDIMKMRHAEDLPIPRGKTVALEPGGYHLMMLDLKQALAVGQSFPLVLTFENAGPVEVEVTVETMGAAGPGMDHGSHDDHGMNGGKKMDE